MNIGDFHAFSSEIVLIAKDIFMLRWKNNTTCRCNVESHLKLELQSKCEILRMLCIIMSN